MAFQGSLKELPLPDIIQLVSVSGKTGVFVLNGPSQTGEIFLRDGEIVHATAGEIEGEEAVYELAIWQEGDFLFKPGTEMPEDVLHIGFPKVNRGVAILDDTVYVATLDARLVALDAGTGAENDDFGRMACKALEVRPLRTRFRAGGPQFNHLR